MFFFRACIKEAVVLTILILGFSYDHILNLKKDTLFCHVFTSRRGMYHATCYLCFVLSLQSKGLNIS